MNSVRLRLFIFLFFALLFGSVQAGQKTEPATPAAKGRKVYIGSGGCVACHARDGAPIVQGAPNFKDAGWQRKKTDAQLARSIREGKGAMPKHSGPESDIPALVAYVRSLAAVQTNRPQK